MAPLKRKRKFWKYHGEYCGPGWSDGKWQDSVCGYATARDEFDQSCKEHDCRYFKKRKLKEADEMFYKQNIGKGVKRSAAAIAVGLQGMTRPRSSSFPQKDIGMAGRNRGRSRTPGRRARSLSKVRFAPHTPRSTPNALRRPPSRSRSRSAARSMSIGSSYRTASVAGARSANVSIASPGHTRVVGSNNKSVTPLSKLMARGVQVCLEGSGVVTEAENVQYIGHAACPNETMKRNFWRALVKHLLIRAQKLNPKWDGVPLDVDLLDTFIVEYRISMDSGSATNQHIYTYVIGATQETIAENWHNFFNGASQQFTITRLLYRPLDSHVGSVVVNLTKSEIELDILSTFKMQNQTVSVAADNEADDVNNVPLIGRCYAGRGTGTRYIVDNAPYDPFICEPKYGVILRDDELQSQLKEPPSPKLFEQVTSSSKVSIAPGEIVTSKIHYQKKLDLQMFITLVWDYATEAAPHRYKMKYLGEFKFYGLEKQIDAFAHTELNGIKIAYEHDLKVAMAVHPKQQTITTQLFDRDLDDVPPQ